MKGADCRINFNIRNLPQADFLIEIHAVFTKSYDLPEPVQRCKNHEGDYEKDNQGV